MRIICFLLVLQTFAPHVSWSSSVSDRYDQRVSDLNRRIDNAQLDLAFADRIRQAAEFIASLKGQTRCIESVFKERKDSENCITRLNRQHSIGDVLLGRLAFAAKNARDPNIQVAAVALMSEIEQAVISLRKSIQFTRSVVNSVPFIEGFRLKNKRGEDVAAEIFNKNSDTHRNPWLPGTNWPIRGPIESISSEPTYVIQGLENEKVRQSFCSLKAKEVSEGKRRYDAEFEKALSMGDLFAMRAAYVKTKALKIGMEAIAGNCELPLTSYRRVIGATTQLQVKSSSLIKALENSIEAMKHAVERKTPADMLKRACGLLQGFAANELNKVCQNKLVNPYVEYAIHLGLIGALNRTSVKP
jgi:hypothetical protein